MDIPDSMRPPGSPTNLEEYWLNIHEFLIANKNVLLNENNEGEDYIRILNTLKETLQAIENGLKTVISATPVLCDLIMSIGELLVHKNIDIKVRFDIVKVLTNLSEKCVLPLKSINYVRMVCFLLQNSVNSLDKSLVVSFIKHLKKLCTHIQKGNVNIINSIEKEQLLSALKVAFNDVPFCVSDAGIEIVGTFVSLDSEFIKEFHERVLRELISCKKTHALNFGKIYFRIWDNLPEEDRQRFEEDYIQWFMDRGCTLGRSEVAQRNLSINVQALLSGLHQSRKKTNFTNVITNLYTPVLWKYLNSNNSIHRCNATEIFMDAYPLEKRGGMKNYSKMLRMQHNEMLQLLDDPCPIIRSVAIKGICLNMQYFWVTFENGTAEKVFKKFISDLVLDGSSCDVRKAVYQGFTLLLKCPESHNLLKCVLPLLKDFIHDENQSVRQAFLFMLIEIKELNCKIKYYDIVDMENIAARLADDTAKNRQLIVRLIFSSFFNEKLTLDVSFSRVCKFIKVNPAASRYLAMYSGMELEFDTAITFMCQVFLKLKNEISRSMPRDDDENAKTKEVDGSRQHENSKRDSSVLAPIDNIRNADRRSASIHNDSQSSSASTLCELKYVLEPRITHGLLDFVGMLWLIHGKTLQKKENKGRLEELYCHTEKCLPIILRYVRGTHAFFGALNIAGMVPLSKLYHVTTIAGACRSMLNNLTLDTPASEYHCIIHALCMWNRGGDVIELTKDWIDEAFRSQSLNESTVVPRTRAGKRVKFTSTESNPMLALRILDELFSSPSDQNLVFSRNLNDLHELLKYLSRIKVVIKRRIEQAEKINDHLSDNFLNKCLELYGNLIIMLNENKVENFDFWEAFSNYLRWCEEMFVESCQIESTTEEQLTDTIAVDLIQVPLKQCINFIALGKCDDEQLTTILRFNSSLLESNYNLHFVKPSLHLIKQLVLFSKAHHVESRFPEVVFIEVPIIVEKLLSILTDKVYSKETLKRYMKSFTDFKNNLIFVYLLMLKLYPELIPSSPSYKMMCAFCQSLINIILFPITECETLTVDQNVKNLPFIGSLMASIFVSQLELASALFYVLKTIVDHFSETDGLKLLACASLLYTFAFSESKISKSEIMKVVKITYNKIQQIPIEDGCLAVVMNYEHSIHDRTIIDVEETTETAIKEIGTHILMKIADKLGGSLQ